MQKQDAFFLRCHFEQERRFSMLIHTEYAKRNSLALELGYGSVSERKLCMIGQKSIFSFIQQTPIHGFVITGIGGIGKWRIR